MEIRDNKEFVIRSITCSVKLAPASLTGPSGIGPPAPSGVSLWLLSPPGWDAFVALKKKRHTEDVIHLNVDYYVVVFYSNRWKVLVGSKYAFLFMTMVESFFFFFPTWLQWNVFDWICLAKVSMVCLQIVQRSHFLLLVLRASSFLISLSSTVVQNGVCLSTA